MKQQSLLNFVLSDNVNSQFVEDNNVFNNRSRDDEYIVPKKLVCAPKPGTRIKTLYSVPKSLMSESELENHKRTLTLSVYDNGYGQPPPPLKVYVETEERFFVPRYYGIEHWGMPEEIVASKGEPMTHEFKGSLNKIQQLAVDDSLKQLEANIIGGAMLVLPCGYGKTVCALAICCHIKVRTLVLVHKSFLVQQWHERAQTFIPDASLGIIRQDIINSDADIVVGMIQSISKRGYSEDLMSKFGLVIVDEAHHMSAPVFNTALRYTPSQKILALSATPERKDGLTQLLFWSMGGICHRIERSPEHTLVSCMIYEGGSRKEIIAKNGMLSIPSMLNMLAKDKVRNTIIAKRIHECYNANRYVIVLSDRLSQLTELTAILCDTMHLPECDIAEYIGRTKQTERDIASTRKIIMTTYSMAKEGLDIPRLDTVVFATPKGDVVQASGRVQRKHSDKNVPLIIDIVDTFSIFEKLRWKRWSFYRNESFQCQTFNVVDQNASWFI